MDCVNYLKCPVNSGILCDFVKEYEENWLEGHKRKHIYVTQCEKYRSRIRNEGG